MHKALLPRDDVERLYVSRKEGRRGLASIEDSVDALIQRLEDYTQKHDGGLITVIRNDTDNTIDNRMTINHHHHHVVPLPRISLVLSRHFSLSFIASGRSSGLHLISSLAAVCMFKLVVLLLLGNMRGSIGVHH